LKSIIYYIPQNNALSYIIVYDIVTGKLFVIPNLIYLSDVISTFYDVNVIVVSVEFGTNDNYVNI